MRSALRHVHVASSRPCAATTGQRVQQLNLLGVELHERTGSPVQYGRSPPQRVDQSGTGAEASIDAHDRASAADDNVDQLALGDRLIERAAHHNPRAREIPWLAGQ